MSGKDLSPSWIGPKSTKI